MKKILLTLTLLMTIGTSWSTTYIVHRDKDEITKIHRINDDGTITRCSCTFGDWWC